MAEDETRGTSGEPDDPATDSDAAAGATADLAKAQADKAAAETRKAEAEARTAEAETRKVEAEANKAEAEVEEVKAQTARAIAEKNTLVAEKERLAAEAARHKAERSKAETETARLETEAHRADADRELADQLNADASGLGIRDFVRQSLLDIMAGVDDAAAMGRTRGFTEGLDTFLPAVTSIGGKPEGPPATDRVKFDLAVAVSRSEAKEGTDDVEGKAEFRVGVLGVGKLHVGASGRIERVTAEGASSEQTNRLSFAVPITYAVQGDTADEE